VTSKLPTLVIFKYNQGSSAYDAEWTEAKVVAWIEEGTAISVYHFGHEIVELVF
jgi:hypothetical protein